jgi:endonuclease/exonuclease/phosphatase (EEP) superfamily protein YafD
MVKNLVILLPKRLWSVLRFAFWSVLWVFGLSLGLLYPIRWFSGDHFSLVRIISYFMPWLLALLVPAMLLAGLAKRKWLLITLAIPTLALCFTFAPLFWPNHNPSPLDDKFSFKMMSHNLFHQQNAGAILEVMRQEQPDILLLQEVHPDLVSMPLHELAGLYPELYVDVVNQPEQGFIQAILCRYPLTRASAEFDRGRVQKVRVETPAGPMAIWNVHPIPPFRDLPQGHDEQVAALVADIAQTDGPLIVAGDFNATDQSATYRAINRYLNNAHQQAGWGFGFTFPAPPYTKGLPFYPGLLYRIDHIFYSDHFAAYDARTLTKSAGSDHLPIVAELGVTLPPD